MSYAVDTLLGLASAIKIREEPANAGKLIDTTGAPAAAGLIRATPPDFSEPIDASTQRRAWNEKMKLSTDLK